MTTELIIAVTRILRGASFYLLLVVGVYVGVLLFRRGKRGIGSVLLATAVLNFILSYAFPPHSILDIAGVVNFLVFLLSTCFAWRLLGRFEGRSDRIARRLLAALFILVCALPFLSATLRTLQQYNVLPPPSPTVNAIEKCTKEKDLLSCLERVTGEQQVKQEDTDKTDFSAWSVYTYGTWFEIKYPLRYQPKLGVAIPIFESNEALLKFEEATDWMNIKQLLAIAQEKRIGEQVFRIIEERTPDGRIEISVYREQGKRVLYVRFETKHDRQEETKLKSEFEKILSTLKFK